MGTMEQNKQQKQNRAEIQLKEKKRQTTKTKRRKSMSFERRKWYDSINGDWPIQTENSITFHINRCICVRRCVNKTNFRAS